MIPVIYYAHNLSIYNTEQEQRELVLIAEFFPNYLIYNPNRPDIQLAANPMKRCFEIVYDTSITDLVFSMLSEEVIGSGVYAEIRAAQKEQKFIYLLRKHFIAPFYGNFEFQANKPKSASYKVLI